MTKLFIPPRLSEKQLRILAIENQEEICLLLHEMFCKLGHSCVPISNCLDALNKLSEREFDMVITDISIPGEDGIELIKRIKADFPELDVRQRLSVSRGYGVAELHIPEGSELVGRTIEQAGLRERDINVLTLQRNTTVIPNPKSSRELNAGDRLLCFGRLEAMRELVPVRIRKARRPKIKKLPSVSFPPTHESV